MNSEKNYKNYSHVISSFLSEVQNISFRISLEFHFSLKFYFARNNELSKLRKSTRKNSAHCYPFESGAIPDFVFPFFFLLDSNKTGNPLRKCLEIKPPGKFQILKKRKNYNSASLLIIKLDLLRVLNRLKYTS